MTAGSHRTGPGPRFSTDITYRGIDIAVLENEALKVLVLTSKGGDIVELRDKQTDVDVLWRMPHRWTAPRDRYVTSVSNRPPRIPAATCGEYVRVSRAIPDGRVEGD